MSQTIVKGHRRGRSIVKAYKRQLQTVGYSSTNAKTMKLEDSVLKKARKTFDFVEKRFGRSKNRKKYGLRLNETRA